MSEIENKVKAIIVDKLGVEESQVTLDASFAADLNADSLDVMEVAMAVGDEYDIEIAEEELNEIKTVGDVVRYVEAAINDD